MDWQRYLSIGALLSVLAACGGSSTRGRALRPGEVAEGPALSMRTSHVLAKQALGYRVAMAPPYLASVELRTEFELVLRKTPGDAKGTDTRRVRLGDATYDITDLVVDAREGRAYVASSAGWVRAYNLETLQVESEWRTGSAATALALSEDNKYLLIGSASGVICLRRLKDGAQLQCMVAHTGRIASMSTSKGRVVTGSWQGEVALWGIPALNKVSELQSAGSVADVAFSPDASMLAVARNQRPPIRTQAMNRAEKKSAALDARGANRIDVHRVNEAGIASSVLHKLEGHRALVSSLCWVGSDLLSGSWDRSVQLWNTQSGSRSWRLGDFGHIIRDLACQEVQSTFAIAAWAPGSDDSAITWGFLSYAKRSRPEM